MQSSLKYRRIRPAAQVNEYGANVTKAHPGKFGFFAALPIPYMNDSLAEIGHALDVLNASGITVMANLHGKYLGDKQYEPMWAELDRRGAVSSTLSTPHPSPFAMRLPGKGLSVVPLTRRQSSLSRPALMESAYETSHIHVLAW